MQPQHQLSYECTAGTFSLLEPTIDPPYECTKHVQHVADISGLWRTKSAHLCTITGGGGGRHRLNQEVALLGLPTLLIMHYAMSCALNLQREQEKGREHTHVKASTSKNEAYSG